MTGQTSPLVSDEQEVRILESFKSVRPTTNPYIVQLDRALRATPGLEVLTFSWRQALTGRYGVFHVHWPEILMEGHKRSGRVLRRLLTLIFLTRLTVTRTPIVRTLHNTDRPSGVGRIDGMLLDWIDRCTTVRIRLNDVTEMPAGKPFVTIAHGHYRDWFASCSKRHAVPGRIGYVGLIRRYKGVDDLLEAFAGTSDPELSLLVAGRPSSAELADTVLVFAAGDPRISAQLAFLDDQEFVDAVTTSALVALPYKHMHNSGAVLAALSLDRPVLVPDTEVNRRLAREVGAGWVSTFEDVLTPHVLEEALTTSGVARQHASPDLRARNWDRSGADHAAAFRLALAP